MAGPDVLMPYTIGVKRRFLFGFRKIKVYYHALTASGLELHRVDGAQELISNLKLARWIVYPDYWMVRAKVEALTRVPGPGPVVEPSVIRHVEPSFEPPVKQPSAAMQEILETIGRSQTQA